MKRITNLLGLIIITFLIFTWYLHDNGIEKAVIKFFPMDEKTQFDEVGSNLDIYRVEDNLKLVADSWSKTNKKVFLRQDVNLLFKNGYLVHGEHPWKIDIDWITDKFEYPLAKENAMYTLLSFHHAEIHQDDIYTSVQAVTADHLFEAYFQGVLDVFKEPTNARQKETKEKMLQTKANQRKELLNIGSKQLNLNLSNYEIYDLDEFSLKKIDSRIITDERWYSILGNLWEGLYKTYVLEFSNEALATFNPPMPWILVDRNGTHILVLYQLATGGFEKLIMQI